MTKTMRRLLFSVGLALPWVALAQGAVPSASLDRSAIGAGETVTLNIEVGDNGGDEPDLSPLMADFVVLGTSTNHSLSIVNGQREAHTILGIALRPRREGHLTVPGLSLGGQRTQPLALEVGSASDSAGAASDKPVQLEGKADPAQVYVGQQIDYTLRLYFAVNLADGQLADPTAEGAEINRVGADANFQTVRGGRRFNVVERHYAIFPQHAGTLEIQAPTFQGTAVDPSDAGAFFGAGSPVNAVATKVSVQVRARPSGATDGAWIPARELKLTLEGMPVDGKARIGQPITLTMHLDATGMPFEALPALSLPAIDGADVYPDKAVTGGSTNGPWVTGRREQGFAVVPTRAGTLHIPATTLHWWNVVTDKAEVATLPARDIVVAAANGAPAAATPAVPATAARTPSPATASTAPSSPSASGFLAGNPWRWLFFGVLVLWLVTMLAWLAYARRRRASRQGGNAAALPVAPVAVPTRQRPAQQAFLALTGKGSPAAIEQALLAWARTTQREIRSLSMLSAALADGPQRAAIDGLQRARFAGGELDRTGLHAAFLRGFSWRAVSSASDGGGLPPLYP